MKKLLLIAISCMYFILLQAQDCKTYYFMQDNKTIEMTIYNKKGDPNGKQVYKVSGVQANGSSVTAILNSEMFDKKGKTISSSKGAIQCNGGVLMIDMKMSLPQQQQEQFSKAEAKAQNFFIEYPSAMKGGDQLKDAVMDMDMETGGLKQSVNFTMTNRKVEGKESVTTTAGTWDCFKISYKSKMVIKTAGIGIPINFEGTEWYAPAFGVVKTESKYGGTAITAIQ